MKVSIRWYTVRIKKMGVVGPKRMIEAKSDERDVLILKHFRGGEKLFVLQILPVRLGLL